MTRTDIIQLLIDKYKLSTYLEIGVFNGENFNKIRCALKDSVDPNFEATYRTTSDKFFRYDVVENYEIIFIDGLHTAEQAYKDIWNAWVTCNPMFIVVHDCNPRTEWHTRPVEEYERGQEWNGTTYQGFIKFKEEHPELSCFTVDADYGCGIITEREMLQNVSCKKYYDYFDANRSALLQLIDVDSFRNLV